MQSNNSNDNRNKFCRLCLKQNSHLNSIFDEDDEATQNDVSKYIYLFFAVEVTRNDPYSTYVCKTCCDILVSMCKYRLKFRKNDALLRGTQQSVKVKFKVTPRCHESVKNIFVKYKKIKLSRELWGVNFNAKVMLHKLNIPNNIIIGNRSKDYLISDSETFDGNIPY